MLTSINCNGVLMEFTQPKLMGILNLTPDSFSDGGKYCKPKIAFKRIEQMLIEGADIIDIGAVSSRPGAELIGSNDEKARLSPVLSELRYLFPKVIFSLDTFRSEIAEWAVKAHRISIINDISGGQWDSEMLPTVAKLQVPYVAMHIKGLPQNMQQNPTYKNVTHELIHYFSEITDKASRLGLHDLIIDPGFGFGKTIEQNYELLKKLTQFKIFEKPILIGISRKSMIYKVLDSDPNEILAGTTAAHTLALINGADILRVHDVKEAKQVIKLISYLS